MLTLKIAALMMSFSFAYGCANESVSQPSSGTSTPGTGGDASFAATEATAVSSGTSSAAAATTAPAPTAVTSTDSDTRSKQVTLLNSEINSEESQLEVQEQNAATLEASLSNAQTKTISPDTGTAIGSGVAGAAEIGLAFATGDIFAGVAGVASLGVSAGSAINASQTANTVAAVAANLQSQLSQTTASITGLKNKIAAQQTQVAILIKEGT